MRAASGLARRLHPPLLSPESAPCPKSRHSPGSRPRSAQVSDAHGPDRTHAETSRGTVEPLRGLCPQGLGNVFKSSRSAPTGFGSAASRGSRHTDFAASQGPAPSRIALLGASVKFSGFGGSQLQLNKPYNHQFKLKIATSLSNLKKHGPEAAAVASPQGGGMYLNEIKNGPKSFPPGLPGPVPGKSEKNDTSSY